MGQLKHPDSLLQIPGPKGVQRVPGAGRPGVSEWPQVHRKIRDAGKLIQFFTSQDPIGSAKGIAMVGDAPAADETEVRALLHKHGADAGA